MPEFILGVDFGLKRVGLAIGQTLTRQAAEMKTLQNTGDLLAQLQSIIEEWQIRRVVVGWPLKMDGEDQAITKKTRQFAEALQQRTGVEIDYVDERLTSRDANQRFIELRQSGLTRQSNKEKIDALAACIILQSWFDNDHSNRTTHEQLTD